MDGHRLRLGSGLTDVRVRREVHDGADTAIAYDAAYECGISDVADDHVRAGNQLAMTARQVVKHDTGESDRLKLFDDV
jgi:hypothetical protein